VAAPLPERDIAGRSSCSISSAWATSRKRARQPFRRAAPARRHRARNDAGARLLLADEPTSSLDPKTSVEIMA